MSEATFIRHLGPAELHDATVRTVSHDGSSVRVRVETVEGRELLIDFNGVVDVTERRSVGMIVYALSEFAAEPPLRRFILTNSDDTDAAHFEVLAHDVSIFGQGTDNLPR